MSDWVRITVIGPDRQPAATWDLEDGWYAAGQYRHPAHHQRARDELATAELAEWLHRRQPAPGTYVIKVTELDSAADHTGHDWACVRMIHPATGPAERTMAA